MQEKILVISDNTESGAKIGEVLKKDSYEYTLMDASETELDFPEGGEPVLIILDIHETALGSELVKQLRGGEKTSELPVVYIVSYDDEHKSELSTFVSDKFELFQRTEDLAELSECVKLRTAPEPEPAPAPTEEEEMSTFGIQNNPVSHFTYQLIKALYIASEAKDPCFKGHSRRTAIYARDLVRRMGGSKEAQFNIYCAALLHDVGMITVPDAIVCRQLPMGEEDMEKIKEHTLTGHKLLRDIEEIPEIGEAARWHHERYDGKGYPDGLSGNDIPYAARVIAVADAYDAMTSERPYRAAMSQEKVREEVVKGIGTQFDPDVAKAMLTVINEDTNYERRQISKKEWKILIVDDDPMVLKMAEFILGRHKQYKTCKATSGKSALKLLKDEQDIDLILLDVEMPIMDGIETLIRIRSDKDKGNIPVIFVTADSTRETLGKAMKYGVSGYITKPFAPHFFIKKINEALNKTV